MSVAHEKNRTYCQIKLRLLASSITVSLCLAQKERKKRNATFFCILRYSVVWRRLHNNGMVERKRSGLDVKRVPADISRRLWHFRGWPPSMAYLSRSAISGCGDDLSLLCSSRFGKTDGLVFLYIAPVVTGGKVAAAFPVRSAILRTLYVLTDSMGGKKRKNHQHMAQTGGVTGLCSWLSAREGKPCFMAGGASKTLAAGVTGAISGSDDW